MGKIIVGLCALILMLQIGAPASAAAAGSYIQINNGNPLSITATEQPQVVVQFGNQGARVDNVRVVCNWNNRIRFTGQAQNGPFPSSQFVNPGFQGLPSLFFPNQAVSDPAQLPDLPTGQNYNVGLGIRIATPAPGFAGNLTCFLLNSNGGIIAQSQSLAVNVR